MSSHVAPFFVMAIMVISIAYIIISWYNYRLKKRIIDAGPVNDDAVKFVKDIVNSGADSLKWGCIAFAAGLGLVVINYVPCDPESPLPYGIEAMFVAAGFLVYYALIRKQQNLNN